MRRSWLAITGALALLAATACGTGAASDGRLSVVAGFYPLQFVAEQVGGDRVGVTNLSQPGAEPHDLELSPRQVATVADAKLVLHIAGFQPALDEALAQNAPASGLDVADGVPSMTAPPGEEATALAQVTDPHLWLDPLRMATIADAVTARLATIDPDGAATYRERNQALRGRLTALDQEYSQGLRTCQRREIIVSHAAFGYLAQRYGLDQIPISGLSPEAEPTPQHLAQVAAQAKTTHATTIFFETLVSPKVAKTIADEVGATTAVLDPIEGLEPGSTDDYFSVMRANLATLRTALGCSS